MQTQSTSVASKLSAYITIARPDHWVKNIFMLPGVVLALSMNREILETNSFLKLFLIIIIGFISTSLIASANYTINEWLDAEFDKHHPTKSSRAAPQGMLKARYVYAQYIILAIIGLSAASTINSTFLFLALFLLLMGVFYNVSPFRSKDKPYLDVLSESINNPIRLALGWSVLLPDSLPPLSALMCYWMGGAYLMAIKRYAEYRLIDNPVVAANYRASFSKYNEEKLLSSAFFYAINSSLFLGIFLIKYRFEYLDSFPFFALLFSWYLTLSMQKNSVSINPERIYKEKKFGLYVCLLGFLLVALLFVDLPFLAFFVDHNKVILR